MHHLAQTPTGPADLALPLALLAEQAAQGAAGPRRAPEVRAATARGSRAARRRRAAAVQG
ncbi:hypothetical protein [Streptomyces sp. NPDC006510]|uniref:hypothetical protein n=1 Tax=Streptomyces sp. NPDC006510 TaxID=3155600 RepID=UPI0033B02A2C